MTYGEKNHELDIEGKYGDGIIKVTEVEEMIKIAKDTSVRKFAEEAAKTMVVIMNGEQKRNSKIADDDTNDDDSGRMGETTSNKEVQN